jgi:hypothetical protein
MSFSTPNNCTMPALDLATESVISRELHQTAQPLTVLQGLLELALLTSCTTEEYREVIQRAMQQSRRISGCFDLVRKLFHVQQPAIDISSFSVSDMASGVMARVADGYAIAGVACEFQPLPHCHELGVDVVTASEGRVSSALELLLSNLPRWTKPGGNVKIAIKLDASSVMVAIHARRKDAEEGSGAPELEWMTAPLHLARTMITSTGGSVVQFEPGFSALISLPRMQQDHGVYETQRIESVHV